MPADPSLDAVSFADIERAALALDGVTVATPCLHAPRLSALTGANVYVKYENMQATGSFKDRGAFIKLSSLSADERAAGVVAMSAGNHAQAVAYHAARLGISATIVMPARTPFVKVAATESHGAKVVLSGETLFESAQACAELQASEGRILVHPYDDDNIIAGQGTVGLEMLHAVPTLDDIIVPVGGGGLIGGIALAAHALKPDCRVTGVEAALYPSAHAALGGHDAPCGGATLAEGIAVKAVGARTLPIIRAHVGTILLVDEEAIERAVNAYLTLQKTMAEGAGAAGLAALMSDPARFQGRTVGLVLCGGNIDARLIASIMVRELARERRIVTLEATFTDEPGVLARITGAVGAAGGNILEVTHHRLALTHPAKATTVRLTIETKDDTHTEAIMDKATQTGLLIDISDRVDGRF
ncbi:MAG: threonine ammonia-lyase [Devosia sp.]